MISRLIRRLIAPITACRVCWQDSKFTFQVEDKYWNKIVPREYRDKNICLGCFDELAHKHQIRYSLLFLTFTGEQESFHFWG